VSTHGNTDQQADAPNFITDASTGAKGQAQYGNTIFAVNATESNVADAGIAPGWVKVNRGKGALEAIEITEAGTGYANTDTINVQNTAGANAAASIVTDADGAITAVTITDEGGLFTVKNPTATITTAEGTGATLTATVGGRAGRVTYETLVALNQVTGDGTDDATFPDA